MLFLGGVFVTLSVAKLAQWVIGGRLRQLAERSETQLDDVLVDALERPVTLLLTVLGLRVSFMALPLPEGLEKVVGNVAAVVATVFIAWMITRVMDAVRRVFVDPWVEASETKLDDQLLPILDKTLKVGVWSMALLICFSNLGFDIVSLLTGLGIGGLAVAMATQATLSNIVGSVTIFADQPFQVGDLIRIGDHLGVVGEVGLRTCRIRTFEGNMVHIPNASVVDQPVINRSPEGAWRFSATLGLVYDTTHDEVLGAMDTLRAILAEHPAVREDYAVRFVNFGDSAVEVMFAYFMDEPTPALYLDTQSEVLLEIKRRFDEAGYSMAFPSVSLYVEQGAPEA